jgi:hypothetical protein
VILRFVENAQKKAGNFNGQVILKPVQSTLVVLGYSSLLISLVFVIACLFWLVTKKIKQIPRWIVITNLVFFIIQIYYFFFSNF